MQQHCSKYITPRNPSPYPGDMVKRSTFIFLERRVAYQIKGNQVCSNTVANISPRPPPTPLSHWPWGIGSKGQISPFSEHGHVAFQIKGNQVCSSLPLSAPTRLENSTHLLVFTSVLGCRASEHFDISSDFFHICKYFLWCRISAILRYFKACPD